MDWSEINPLIIQFERTLANLPGLTDNQRRIERALQLENKRFLIIRTGRRWGKTILCRHILLSKAAENKGVYLWLEPTYAQAENLAFKLFSDIAQSEWDISVGRLRIILPNGSIIYFAGSENYNSFRGYSLSGAVLDECRNIAKECWTEVIRPALADNQGFCLFASTPNGYDWFWRLTQDSQNKDDWAQFHFTSYDNPFIPKSEIDSLAGDLSQQEYQQEVLAEFIKGDGQVFRNLNNVCIIGEPDLPENHVGHTIVGGLDFAQIKDFTVFTLGCVECKKIVSWDRYNQIDFHYQRERIVALANKWKVWSIIGESNSIGMPNIESLKWDYDLPIEPFPTTAQSKPPLIRALIKVLEDGKLLVPREYFGELSAYEARQNPNTGFISYQGASGIHDDRVMSLAICYRAMVANQGSGILVA